MKQSEQSKLSLEESLINLLSKKSYKSITIKDIVEKAGLCRLTFYRNFETKDDLICSYFNKRYAKYRSTILENRNGSKIDLEYELKMCFEFFKHDAKIIEKLALDGYANILFNIFNKHLDLVLTEINYNNKVTDYQKIFFLVEYSKLCLFG